jgi:uncharacterized protein (DUF2062 family)
MPAFRQKIHEKLGALPGNLLTQGTSPHKLALTIALGVITGILPVVWGSTLLCAVLAYLFRLNQAGIQAANYLACPLQIALFVPFYRIGAKIFPWGQSVSVEVIAKQFKTDWGGKIPLLLVANLKALGAWFLIAPPAAILLYLIFLPILARIPLINPKTYQWKDNRTGR